MVGKIVKIGLLVVLAVVSFGVSFIISGKLKPAPTEQVAEKKKIDTDSFDLEKELLGGLASVGETNMNPKERQLDELIREVRAKLKKLDRRQRDIIEREKRLGMATEHLKKQSEEIGNLQIELNTAVNPLKEAKRDLERFKTQIKAQEVLKLQSVAKMYGTMKAAKAAKILLKMCDAKLGQQAAKIIHFLPEKKWAKIMDQIKESGKAVEIINRQLQVIQITNEDGKS